MPRAQHKISQSSQPSQSDRRGQALYEQDFYAWVGEQVEALRSGHTQGLDIENLAEEIEDMGRSQRRAVKSALIIILIHLLKYRYKYRYQPQHRTNSWRASIREHRRRVRDELADSPSLRPHIEHILDDCYQDTCEAAADKSGLPVTTFPAVCPFALEQALDRNFLPG